MAACGSRTLRPAKCWARRQVSSPRRECMSFAHHASVEEVHNLQSLLCIEIHKASMSCGAALINTDCCADHGSSVEAVLFAHSLALTISAGMDGKLLIWENATLEARSTCEHPEVGTQPLPESQ